MTYYWIIPKKCQKQLALINCYIKEDALPAYNCIKRTNLIKKDVIIKEWKQGATL